MVANFIKFSLRMYVRIKSPQVVLLMGDETKVLLCCLNPKKFLLFDSDCFSFEIKLLFYDWQKKKKK